MAYWLLKSEPSDWSWADQAKAGAAAWSGVKNPQALKNLKAMTKGDLCFFYHTGNQRAIVGTVSVARAFYPDPRDKTGRFGMVDVKAERPLKAPVTLDTIKNEAAFKDFALVRQGRLSVVPVDAKRWISLCRMGGIAP